MRSFRWWVPAAISGLVFIGRTASAQEPTAASAENVQVPATLDVPPKISFLDAIHRAVSRNPNAQFAIEEIRRFEALREEARATWLPNLNAAGSYNLIDPGRARVLGHHDWLNGNLSGVVPIVSTRQWAFAARAREQVDIAKIAAGDTRKAVATAAGRAYITVLTQHRVVETSERALENAKAHEDFANQRLKGGIGNRLDAVRASQERATSEAQVRQQQINLIRAEEQLGQALGEDHAVDVGGEADLGTLPSLQGALGDVSQKRLDVVAQRERAESARRAIRDNYTDYLPVLSANGTGFLQDPAILGTPASGWSVQLLLTLPLYDGGLRYGLEHERAAIHEEQKERLDLVLRQARSDVRVAFETVRRADEALEKAREAARLANEARELTDLAYKAGATSNLEVIDAERRARDADTAAVVAEDTSRQARLDLLAACGRFPDGM